MSNLPLGPERENSRAKWLIFFVIFLVAIASFLAVREYSKHENLLRIYFLDVGQGDSVFIESPNGNQVLIDGGPDNKVIEQLGAVMPFYDRSIDALLLTHTDSDHLTGLISVLDRFSVSSVLETKAMCVTTLCSEWSSEISSSKATDVVLKSGTEIDIGGGAKLSVIYPFVDIEGKKFTNINEESVVVKLTYGNQSVILPGDIDEKIENKIVLSGINVDADFIKLAHHGSKTSNSEVFLKAVSPLAAFISVGANNKFGHPSPIVLNRLEKLNIPYYRTDTDGLIELTLDGKNYSIKK